MEEIGIVVFFLGNKVQNNKKKIEEGDDGDENQNIRKIIN